MAVTALADEVHRVISAAVDGTFYRAVYPDLARAQVDPIRHYATTGWREGRDPAPWFSSMDYLKACPDVAKADWNPLHHYLAHGRREGREVVRSRLADAYLLGRARRGLNTGWRFEPQSGSAPPDPVAETAEATIEQRALAATEFDATYYVTANPDLVGAGIDPLDHFMLAGWREGRDPNPLFSVKDYLETYPDIAAVGVNPFVHYLQTGRAEGRIARNELGFRYEIIKRLAPLADRVEAVTRATARLTPGTAAALGRALAQSRTGLADLHVTFSHDDYTSNTGGVQLCLQREGAKVAALGRDHLHLHPAKPWPVVRSGGDDGRLGVVFNGVGIGLYEPAVIARVLGKAASAKAGQRSFAIHSLLGHSADETVEILGAVGLTAGYFWLHDFASLCAGFHLLRNDVEDCAAPPPDSAACGICVYGPWRARHLEAHERLFNRLALTVVSPSQPTIDLWRKAWSFPAKAEVVLPHARLVERGPAPKVKADRPFRLAFAGMPVAHKGWEVFRALVSAHKDDRRYEFHHLGGQKSRSGLPIAFHKIVVTEENPKAMQGALEKLSVDAVLIWPLCRETFSFTAYEAVAAGAAVITGPDSGNVAAFVAETGHGRVLADEAALAEALQSGAIAGVARAARKPMLYDLAFSALTVDLLGAEAMT